MGGGYVRSGFRIQCISSRSIFKADKMGGGSTIYYIGEEGTCSMVAMCVPYLCGSNTWVPEWKSSGKRFAAFYPEASDSCADIMYVFW